MTLLWMPLLIFTRTISFCKARQAVATSSVKIYGRDVAATWKILTTLFVAPALYVVYIVLSGHLASAGLPLVWQREVMLCVLFLLPPLTLAYIHLGERILALARSLLPLLALTFQSASASTLPEQREALRQMMVGLVDEELGFRADTATTPRGPSEKATWHKEEWGEQWRASHPTLSAANNLSLSPS